MSNTRKTEVFSFETGDLPLIAHALMIARNTEMMSGRRLAADRADAIAKGIIARAPDVARFFDDGVFCEMCATLATSPEWSVSIEKDWRTWRNTGPIYVTVGKRRFRSDDTSYTEDGPEIGLLKAFLDEVSPMSEMTVQETSEVGPTP